jgi:hypothetical protein
MAAGGAAQQQLPEFARIRLSNAIPSLCGGSFLHNH